LDGAARLIRAVDRSGQSGAALAGSFHRVAEDLRTERLLAAEATARRAGVLIVLPLGLCFLPAFVLTGLVPVMVAVVGGVLSTSP
jgi:pilus assembly protein TadC